MRVRDHPFWIAPEGCEHDRGKPYHYYMTGWTALRLSTNRVPHKNRKLTPAARLQLGYSYAIASTISFPISCVPTIFFPTSRKSSVR